MNWSSGISAFFIASLILSSLMVLQVSDRAAAFSPTAGQDILVDPSRPVIYWAGADGNDLKFINSSTGEVIDSVVVGTGPTSVCLSPDGTTLYVAIPSYDCIIEVDAVSRAITDNITLTFSPFSIGLDGGDYMYVSGTGADAQSVYSIDMRTWKVKNSEVVGWVNNVVIEISPDGSTLLAMELGISPHKIFRYGINAGVFSYQDVDNHDLGAAILNEAVDWARDKIYITSGYPYGIEVVSISTLNYLGVYMMDSYGRCLSMSVDGKYVYGSTLSGISGSSIWMFNTSDGSAMGWMSLAETVDYLAIAQDSRSAFIGMPIQRVELIPIIDDLYPAKDSILGYTPSFLTMSIQGGLPQADQQNLTIHIDGVPLDTYQYDMLGDIDFYRGNTTQVLSEGYHSFGISVPYLDGILWSNASFLIDRNSSLAIRPAVFPNQPENGSIVLVEPLNISAFVVYQNYDMVVEGGWITWDGQNLTTAFFVEQLLANYSSPPSLGQHNISAFIYWDGGLGKAWANWTIFVVQGPLLTPLYPARDQVLTQLPNYVEVAIDPRDAGSNISSPQIYIDDRPVQTSFTDNSSMRAWITSTLKTGNHTGRATLDWPAGKITMTWSFSVAVFVGPNDELLERHQYKDEFSLLVPQSVSWSLEEDSDIAGVEYPLVLYGSTYDSFRTNIIVSSQRDAAVEEAQAYLEDQLEQALDELEQSGISAVRVGAPDITTIDNHTALVGLIRLEGYSVYQKIVIIASEEHERLWMMIFSISMTKFNDYSEMFDLMIDSFEIEMKPPSPVSDLGNAAIGIGIAALAGGVAGAVVWLTRRRREQAPPR